MLSNIHIENIAVIKNIDLDLSAGFCAITGETGAGKSVIMDAIKLLAGAKTDRELIRRGEDRAQVSGLFCNVDEAAVNTCRELGYDCEDGELLVTRSISSDGRSSVRINGKSATAAIQKKIVGSMLDFHGQHDNVTLLDSHTHLRMLDEYADNGSELDSYREKYAVYTEARRALADHLEQSRDKERELDFLRAQIKEIEAVKPKAGEEEKLEADVLRLSSIEKIRKQTTFVYRALLGGEKGNACMLIDKSAVALESLGEALPECTELSDRLKNVYYELSDIAQTVDGLADVGSEDPTIALDRAEARLDAIRKLKKKYGSDVNDIIGYLDGIKEKVNTYENSEQIAIELKKKYKAALSALGDAAKLLSERRTAAAQKLSSSVAEVLDFLDMPKVRFEARVTQRSKTDKKDIYTSDGGDDVVFLLAMTSSEPLLELSNASGGEISRVMLALKSVLSEKYGRKTVIYDEIDAGVSGKTARKIGLKLRDSAQGTQVLCVTHSAQIASLADVHYKITKESFGERLESRITELDREGRVDELSRILGGINVTESQRQAALDMLESDS